MQLPHWFIKEFQESSFRTTDWAGIFPLPLGQRRHVGSSEHSIFFAVREGRVEVKSWGRSFDMVPGQMLMIPAGEPFEMKVFQGPTQALILPFLIITARPLTRHPLSHLPLPVVVEHEDGGVLEAWMGRFSQLLKPDGKIHHQRRLRANLLGQEVLLEYLEQGFDQGCFGSEPSAVPKWLLQARDLLERNFQDPDLSVARVADGVHYSSWHLQKAFKEHFGVTPKAHLHAYRMVVASRLLKNNPKTKIASLLKKCGYRNLSFFIQTFKKHFGFTPSQMRKQDPPMEEPGGSLREGDGPGEPFLP